MRERDRGTTSAAADPVAGGLRRTLSLPLITLYGVGTIIGGGIYALLGKVAGEAGMAAPLSFLIAAVVAGLSALSFAELCARMPYSAGEARYVSAAFGTRWLGPLVGGLVVSTGVVSAATLANAVGDFLVELLGWPHLVAVLIVVALLALVAVWGIAESAIVAAVVTLIELGGLVVVVVLRGGELAELAERWPEVVRPDAARGWTGVLFGAFLAFYAYIGFEDMVNVAEEVREPRRNLPIAILTALVVTSVLYVLVCLVAVLAVPPDELARTRIPLADLTGADRRGLLSSISVLAGVNGALVQVVMAARVVYGLREQSRLLGWLGRVHRRTRTPARATVAIAVVVLALAVWLPLVTLATATSTIILVVFALVNLALVRIKRREPDPPERGPRYPVAVPILAFLLCVGFLALRVAGWLGAGAG